MYIIILYKHNMFIYIYNTQNVVVVNVNAKDEFAFERQE
jgi:hypothetical protein